MDETKEVESLLRRSSRQAVVWALVLSSMISTPMLAAQTDISSSPITSTNAAQVKPNVMLLMDTSASMGWAYMPDEAGYQLVGGASVSVLGPGPNNSPPAKIGFKAAECNILYYNRNQTYELPKKPNGDRFDQPSFDGAGAPFDGFDASSSKVRLDLAFKAYETGLVQFSNRNDIGRAAYYYYRTGGPAITAFNSPACINDDNDATVPSYDVSFAPDGGTWNRVVVGSGTGVAPHVNELNNFATWYSFYRTRMLLIKSAASLAFTPLTDSFRVGFITASPKETGTSTPLNLSAQAPINQDKYLAIDDFTSVQRGLWYGKLFAQKPGGTSPAREGLARVGRHYAGKHDGINTGMAGDPVQFSCQQNFTIMTTDGYWNTQDESTESGGYIGGPVDNSGKALVGQRDGDLDKISANSPSPLPAADFNVTPRPIWDGTYDGLRTVRSRTVHYAYAPCGTYFTKTAIQFFQTTTQLRKEVTQTRKRTHQVLSTTVQNLQTTNQMFKQTLQSRKVTLQTKKSTHQALATTLQKQQNTYQRTASTLQHRQQTNQNLISTYQTLKSTVQLFEVKRRLAKYVYVPLKTTKQKLLTTRQTKAQTTQAYSQTVQQRQTTIAKVYYTDTVYKTTTQSRKKETHVEKSTIQNVQSSLQHLQSTTQTLQRTSQTSYNTIQYKVSTSQLTLSTVQKSKSTYQLNSCRSEVCTPVPVGTCVSGNGVVCQPSTTGPSLVAECVEADPDASNSYTRTTCDVRRNGPLGASACTPREPAAGNSFIRIVCDTVTTGPTSIAACNTSGANGNNDYTATTCTPYTAGPIYAPSNCADQIPAQGNDFVRRTCTTATTGPVGVDPPTCRAQNPDVGNDYKTITCTPNNTTDIPVSVCTMPAPSSNSWITTTCRDIVTTDVPVASCTPSGATANNFWTAYSCRQPTTGPTTVDPATCSVPYTAAGNGNSYTATTCNSIDVYTPSGTCVAADPSLGNGWVKTVCNVPLVVGPTAVLPSNCNAAPADDANQWTRTDCPVTTRGPTEWQSNGPCFTAGFYGTTDYYRCVSTTQKDDEPVANCVPAYPWYPYPQPYVTTTCNPVIGAKVPQAPPCSTIAATSLNSYTATNCGTDISPITPVQTCVVDTTTTLANNYKSTACFPNNVIDTPVQTCSPVTAVGPNWIETTCRDNDQVGFAVDSCTYQGASGSNSWVETTCPPEMLVSGPEYVTSCSAVNASAGNGHQRTDCVSVTVSTIAKAPGTCTPENPSGGNGNTTTTCETSLSNSVGVDTCTAVPPQSPDYIETVCTPNNVLNQPTAACLPKTRNGGNQWTETTCPTPNKTGPTPVLVCAPVAAAFPDWISTSCSPDVVSGPTGVDVCNDIAPIDTNLYTQTTCADNNTGPTGADPALCKNEARGSGNQWTRYVCSDNNRYSFAVATCSASPAGSGNLWVATSCPAAIDTGPTGVQSCLNDPLAVTGNNFTTTLCTPNNADVPSGDCQAEAAKDSNSWTETRCPTIDSGFLAAPSCNQVGALDGNAWTAVNCNPFIEIDKPVATCLPMSAANPPYKSITCRQPAGDLDRPVQTCSPGTSNTFVVTTCVPVDTDVASGDCRPEAAASGNGWTETTCPTVIVTALGGTNACVPVTGDGNNAWTTTSCPGVLTVGPNPGPSCPGTPADSGNNWTATSCTFTKTVTTGETVCNAVGALPENSYTKVTCLGAPGSQKTTTTTLFTQQYQISGGTKSGPSTDTVSVTGPTASGQCYAPGTEPVLAPDANDAWTTADAANYPSCTGWPCTIDLNVNNPRSINSLADVSQYYYVTDLRAQTSGQYVGAQFALETPDAAHASDDVPGVGAGDEDDRARWQHMTTFTIALGVSGTLKYGPNYKKALAGDTTSDFPKLRCKNPANCQQLNWPLWPNPTPGYYTTNGQVGGPLNDNLYSDPRSIDDFWHAAVNGRGTYFSAGNPTSVIAGLSEALAGINARIASSTGAGTSNLEPVTGDNYVYLANYATSKWVGDVQSHEINVSSGAIETPIIWSAQRLLDQAVGAACDNRTIYLFRQGATNNLTDFSLNSKSCNLLGQPTGAARTGLNATEQANFGISNVQLLSQYPSMTGSADPVDQKSDAVGASLVNFLRGQRGKEQFLSGVADKLYRQRDNVLGDIVDGQPVYVRAPFAAYNDAGYAAYKATPAIASRKPMLYVAANDGMLHAFFAGTSLNAGLGPELEGGKEAWAMIPTPVLPNLFLLADNNYKNNHRYFVDGTPSVSDAKLGANWKTLLVAGLNSGGRGYYALDVTDPLAPKGLWEFKLISTCYDGSSGTASLGGDCHLGLTFGKPLITKLNDGRWVVMVTSGYNNVNANPIAGDGMGYLYVLDAATGSIIYKISTGVGSAAQPSGLAQINNYVENADQDNVTVRVYGTDVLGNIWRFDVNNNTAPSGLEATLLATTKDPDGLPQPITTRAEITSLGDKPMLFVATGKLLGATDVADLQRQSIYGIVDPITSSPYTGGNSLRSQLAPLALTQQSGQTYRTVRCTGSTAACGSTKGWFVDLPDPGERVNVEMKLRSYTLIVGSNVPQISACSAGGYSWLNYFDYKTGLKVAGVNNLSVSQSVANSLIVGLTVVKLSDGTMKAIITTSDAGVLSKSVDTRGQPLSAKRISWREVIAQ